MPSRAECTRRRPEKFSATNVVCNAATWAITHAHEPSLRETQPAAMLVREQRVADQHAPVHVELHPVLQHLGARHVDPVAVVGGGSAAPASWGR